MRLSNLIASSDGLKLNGNDVEITGITADSRNVEPGFLFIAIPGTKHDGRLYIEEAIQQGAVAILSPEKPSDSLPLEGRAGEGGCKLGKQIPESETKHLPEFESKHQADAPPPCPSPQGGGDGNGIHGLKIPTVGVTTLTTPHIRLATSSLAATFYPRQPETIVAVTGTSGKTSTAQFTRELWQALGHKSASIGTLGLVTSDESRYGSLTTPDALTLHQLLNETASKGVTHLAMEASSHGLELNRLDHVNIKAGGFTNLSRDHLDYHATMENYLAAKMRLFTTVMKAGATAVLNADSETYEPLAKAAQAHGLKVMSYGLKGKEIKLTESVPDTRGQILRFNLFGKNHEILLPVAGSFQIGNSLCALGMVLACGEDETKSVEALTQVTGVPGRLQFVGHTKNGASVFVDYAHKPDALENVLKALRPHVAAKGSKLGVIFGCGGNRDKGKRPIMGEIAQRLADWVIVTDDNPRNEEPAVIRQEVLAGCIKADNLFEIGDRAQAIQTGIEKLNKNDVLIIAGKGHEVGQIIGDHVLPFDDADVARGVLGL